MSAESNDTEDLLDRYLDGTIEPEELTLLDHELKEQPALRQELRSRIRLHGLLSDHYRQEDGDAGLTAMAPFLPLPPPTKSRRLPALALAAAAVIALGLYLFPRQGSPRDNEMAAVQRVANASWETGEVVEIGEVVSLEKRNLVEGFLEMEMANGIHIAIESPAVFQFLSEDRLRLDRGHLSAQVPEGAEGFTVVTSAGEVIDLGTRFGVSVEGDAVEAHVFEGEIKVNSKGTESILLEKEEAISLGKKKRYHSDAESFPMPSYPLPVALQDGDFEIGPVPEAGIPGKVGHWGGDSASFVGSTSGITPVSGTRMLQFHATRDHLSEPETGQQASELWQLVDLSAFSDEVNRGGVVADLQAAFNRAAQSPDTDTKFGIGITAFRGSIPDAAEYWDRKREPLSERLSQAGNEILTDADPSTWESAECRFTVPRGTDFLMIQVFAFEDVRNEEENEFSGHFADAIHLALQTEARPSRPRAEWEGGAGSWNNPKNWKAGRNPDGARDEIFLQGQECLVDHRIELKQNLTIAPHNDSIGILRISREGALEKSGTGQLIVGYNEGAIAELIIEGRLLTAGPVFIGRNNRRSEVHVNQGSWVSREGIIRMAQYGNRGPDTASTLRVSNGGSLTAESMELVHDLATIQIESGGTIDTERLRVGGSEGAALVAIQSGVLRVRQLEFGSGGTMQLLSADAVLELAGDWNSESLRKVPDSRWEWSSDPTFESIQVDGETWTRIRLPR
ncbi:MAG: FecR domain-containing protein [Verrucomicrobiales bacterium]|nr:FecR domain-containing protein [Verrucomicrobiales bacterium]